MGKEGKPLNIELCVVIKIREGFGSVGFSRDTIYKVSSIGKGFVSVNKAF